MACEKVEKAVELIGEYGYIDGAHHKQWLLDQVVRTLLSPTEYKTWVEGVEWDIGTAP